MRRSQDPESGRAAPSGRLRSVSIAAAVLAIAALALASCDRGGSDAAKAKSSAPVAAARAEQASTGGATGPEAAIAKYLQSQTIEYVGDCTDATLPRDKGKWCSTLVAGDGKSDTLTYDLGPVRAKSQKTITLKRQGSAVLTPGDQVGVADGNVATPSQLTRAQLENDTFITGNLLLDQAAGIGNGLSDLPAGAPSVGTGGGGAPPTTALPAAIGGVEATKYPPTGGIVVETPTVEVGGEVAFRGSGCTVSQVLQVFFDGHPIGTVIADPQGSFAGSIGIPRGTAPGAHTLTVAGSGCIVNTTINVAGNLAFTGSSNQTGTYVLAGVAAVVVGLVLVVGTRRRRRTVRRDRHQPPPSPA